jgi:transcriptional regulator with XRE-family HTH domain
VSINSADDDVRDNGNDAAPYAKALGARLRAVRMQQHLSLHGVERKSEGRWKAVVVGSYERGDRAVSVQRLAELAEFYGVPITDLLPRDSARVVNGAPASSTLTRVVLNLERLRSIDDPQAELVQRFADQILRQRGGPTGRNLPLRYDDLSVLALLYDTTTESITDRLVRMQVLSPESLILDGEP